MLKFNQMFLLFILLTLEIVYGWIKNIIFINESETKLDLNIIIKQDN